MPSVLVVDDAAVDRRFVGELLAGDAQWQVHYAANGAEALASLRHELPDVVITDLLMPEIDGLELVATAREQYPLLPVILMTSQGNEEVAVRALQHGAASYVPKRMLVHHLRETLQKVLAASSRERGLARLMGCMTHSESTFVLENDCALFGPLVAYLQEGATQMGLLSDADRTRVGVALEEALANAMFHGNLEVGSELREQDVEGYQQLIETRRRLAPYSDRRIEVRACLAPERATFVVRDAGRGFDPSTLPDPTDPENLEKSSGRGILLMRTFMDEIAFNAAGNTVTLVKRRHGRDGATPREAR
jgi:CheY-like chemotaxis protein